MSRWDDVPVIADAQTGAADCELACRRSLRGSRARRAAAALRRRRTLRSRCSAFVATAGLLVLSAGAIGATGGAQAGPALSKEIIAEVQATLGVASDGVIGPATRRAIKRFQRARGLKPDGLLGPRTLRALAIDPDGQVAVSVALDPRLAQIAQCESGGDPTAVSADGLYRGKYQFDRETWRSVGGRGDPAQAPEREQDRRAARLLARDGTTPWPNCA